MTGKIENNFSFNYVSKVASYSQAWREPFAQTSARDLPEIISFGNDGDILESSMRNVGRHGTARLVIRCTF